MAFPSRSMGTTRWLRIAQSAGEERRGGGRVRVALVIAHLDDRAVQDCGGHLGFAAGSPRVGAVGGRQPLVRPVMMSDEVNQMAVEPIHTTAEAIAEGDGALGNGVEHRLHVGRRAGDDSQYLACRRLLFQSFGQRALHVRVRRRWLGTPFEALGGTCHIRRRTSDPRDSRAGTGDTASGLLPAENDIELPAIVAEAPGSVPQTIQRMVADPPGSFGPSNPLRDAP